MYFSGFKFTMLLATLPSISAAVLPRQAGALGGAAPAITNSGNADRPFSVNGNTFVNESAAVQRACDIQNNACFNAFNANPNAAGFSQADCTQQQQACVANTKAPAAATGGNNAGADGANGADGATNTGDAADPAAADPTADDECDA